MKIFCAYAFTGEDINVVTSRMRMVVDSLNENGHEAYCNRFDKVVDKLQADDDIKGIFKEAFKNIATNEVVVAVITSPKKSVGQIMEIGIALSLGKPVYLFEHTSSAGSSYIPRLVDRYFEWETEADLKKLLRKI